MNRKSLLLAHCQGFLGMINSDGFDSGGRKELQEYSPTATNVQDWGAIAEQIDEPLLNAANGVFAAAELVKADRSPWMCFAHVSNALVSKSWANGKNVRAHERLEPSCHTSHQSISAFSGLPYVLLRADGAIKSGIMRNNVSHCAISVSTIMKLEVLERCNVCDSNTLYVVDPDCNITRCRACGYIFDSPRPTPQELVEFYSRPGQYDSWLNQLEPRQRLWRRRLNALRPTQNPGSLLDVGAGIGQFLDVARDSYSEIYGTEVSSTAIQIAKEKYNLNLFQGTIEDLEMARRTFANVTLFHVLEHVPDPKSMLRRCHSLLSPQGILVIAVPNEVASLRASLRKILVRARVKKQRRVGKFGLPRINLDRDSAEVHLSHFTPSVLRRLLHATGFSIVKETLDPYYVAEGAAKLKADAYYYCCLAFLWMLRVNIYDAMLVIAQKEDAHLART